MPYSPMNQGNVLAQAERINALREAQNPYSMDNMYKAAQIHNVLNPKIDKLDPFQEIPGMEGVHGQKNARTGEWKNITDTNKKADKGTGLMQEALAIGLTPGTVEYEKFIRQGRTRPLYELGSKKEQDVLAERRADTYWGLVERSNEAEQKISGLRQLQNIDVATGFGQQFKTDAARLFKFMGFEGSEKLLDVNIANVQSFNAVVGKMVLDTMATQKGPQTKEDQLKIAETLPNITNEADANRFILQSVEAIERRNIEREQFWTKYLDENETLNGVRSAWNKYKNSVPMVSDSILNPDTGLPMFYFQFEQQLQKHNPGVTRQQTIDKWKELND